MAELLQRVLSKRVVARGGVLGLTVLGRDARALVCQQSLLLISHEATEEVAQAD